MSSIKIEVAFEYAGGWLQVELTENTAEVVYSSGDNYVTIERSFGEVTDWFNLYQKKWLGLSGAALKSSEEKFAKEYAIEALGNWIEDAAEIVSQCDN